MFDFGNHILEIQGHPKYTNDILLDFIDNLLNKKTIEVSNMYNFEL